MQRKKITNIELFTDISGVPPAGRILALDPGAKRVGVAICDETRTITRPLPKIDRRSWKSLLSKIRRIIDEFDAVAVVIGLPLEFSGEISEMTHEALQIANKLSLSLNIPVFMQDERVTSYEAKGRLWKRGVPASDTKEFVDSEAASIILSDFLTKLEIVSGTNNPG